MARKNKATEMACHGHSDLNVFAAIQAILEGGVIYDTASLKSADRIIAICRREQSRLFQLHERGVEKINEQIGDHQ